MKGAERCRPRAAQAARPLGEGGIIAEDPPEEENRVVLDAVRTDESGLAAAMIPLASVVARGPIYRSHPERRPLSQGASS
jgi:hypothetical protein